MDTRDLYIGFLVLIQGNNKNNCQGRVTGLGPKFAFSLFLEIRVSKSLDGSIYPDLEIPSRILVSFEAIIILI